MKKNKDAKQRLLVIGLLIVIALVAGGIAGWNFFKYRLIKHKVSSLLYKNSNGLYTVEYDSLTADEIGGSLTVTNLRLIPDTARFRKLYTTQQATPSILVGATIPLLRVTGVKTPKAVLSKQLEGGKVAINNAGIVLYYVSKEAGSANAAAPAPSRQQTLLLLLSSLRLIQADTLQVENASLSVVDFIDNQQRIERASVSLHLYDILIDSASVTDTSRFFFARRADARITKLVVTDKKGFYNYTVDEAQFTTAGRSCTIKNFRVAPLLGEDETMRAAGIQVDRYDIHFGIIALGNINLPQLMNGIIVADNLAIKESSFKIYRDLGYPRSPISRVGRYPQQSIMRLGISFNIKKIRAAGAFIEYKEKNARSDSSGKVQFYHSAVTITHLTNMDAAIAKDNNCTVDFDARFLDMATLRSVIVLKLKDPDGRFTVKGTLGGFDATRLNALLEPMALAKVDNGRINKLDFMLNCDNYTGRGNLTLLYNDLKISVLKKDNGDNQLKEKKLASLIANIVVKNNNPGRKDKAPRQAAINNARLPDRSFFNLIWKSILSGIKTSVGM